MKNNTSLFAVKKKNEIKSESLVDNLNLIYEKNFKMINQIFFGYSINQAQFKYSSESLMQLVLSSNQCVPDIQIDMNFLSPFTVDVEMYYNESDIENVKYIYNVKFRLYLDAKILEVKETGLHHHSIDVNQKSNKELSKKHINQYTVHEKLTKSLLVYKWLKKLVVLEYSLNKTQ